MPVDLLPWTSNVPGVDRDAERLARARCAATGGPLALLTGWLAGVRGSPLPAGARAVLLVVGAAESGEAAGSDRLSGSDWPARPGDAAGVLVPTVTVDPGDDVVAAVGIGAAAVDRAVDAGVDVIAVAAEDVAPAAAVAALLGRLEPAQTVDAMVTDPAAWAAAVTDVRDRLRQMADLRHRMDDLLEAAGSPALAATTGLLLAAARRRTPVVVDPGPACAAMAVAAAASPVAAYAWRCASSPRGTAWTAAWARVGGEPVLDLQVDGGGALPVGLPCQLALPIVLACGRLVVPGTDPDG